MGVDPAVGQMLDRFADRAVGAAPHVHQHAGGEHDFSVVIAVCVHGDEVGPLPAALRLVEDLRAGRRRYGGRLAVVVGNPAATRAGVRYLDSDLNRVFVERPPDDIEGRRARDLSPLLDDADVLLDLHQTSMPTRSAFWTLPWTRRDGRWVAALRAAPVWMARPSGQVFSPGTCCLDEYVRNRGRVGLTLEMSQRGLDRATEQAAARVLDRLLRLADGVGRGALDLDDEAGEVTVLETIHVQPFSDPALALRAGLVNLQPVAAGTRLSPPGAPVLRSPATGLVAFPKYPPRDEAGRAVGPLPGELYRLAAPLSAPPEEVWGG
ncbi:MAG: hypothetical protein D6798_05975 [Deltaproteobacteria bacterium]|nr:MAG: hypothetical protein D6798_05975 [Deltaproteobacteria bacterium]